MSKLFADLMDKKTPAAGPTPLPLSPVTSEVKDVSKPIIEPEVPQEQSTEKIKSSQASNITTLDATNIAILQLTKDEIDELRETAYKAQTFRFSEDELNWLRDRSYGLTRALGKKVGQNDLLRLSLKIFRKLATDKQKILEEILDPII